MKVSSAKTVNGNDVRINAKGGSVMVDGAFIMRDHRILTVDEESIVAEANQRLEAGDDAGAIADGCEDEGAVRDALVAGDFELGLQGQLRE